VRRFSSFLAAFATLAAALTIASSAHADSTWRLPWRAGQQVFVTQDCNDSCCSDHVGHNAYAWDFATYGAFDVVAPRAGTIVHVKMSSNRGGDANEVDASNYIVIDHGDGTASIFLHLAQGSLDPGIQCGAFVRQGQRLAVTGATGWASGNHLHFQVNRIPPTMNRTCECGPDGMACGAYESHWDLFWSRNAQSTSVPVSFEEWPQSSQCADRHDEMVVTSRNVDRGDSVIAVDSTQPGRFVPIRGEWSLAPGGMRGRYHAAASNAEAAALVPLQGVVNRPGVYEVWTSLPAEARNTGAAVARAEVIARGERSSQMQRQAVAGGAYRPLTGRFKFTGRAGEGVVMSAFAHEAESLAVDGLVLRRVGDVGHASAGAACRASTECAGDLVCNAGVCAAGCEQTGCANGDVCDATGVCMRSASDPAVETAMSLERDWRDDASVANRAATVAAANASTNETARPEAAGVDRGHATSRAHRGTNRTARRDASVAIENTAGAPITTTTDAGMVNVPTGMSHATGGGSASTTQTPAAPSNRPRPSARNGTHRSRVRTVSWLGALLFGVMIVVGRTKKAPK
jgi:hypothetical protein